MHNNSLCQDENLEIAFDGNIVSAKRYSSNKKGEKVYENGVLNEWIFKMRFFFLLDKKIPKFSFVDSLTRLNNGFTPSNQCQTFS